MNLLYAIALTAGMWNGGLVQYQRYVNTKIDNPCFVDIDIDVQYGPVFVAGGVRTDMWMNKISNYYPFQNTYAISAGLRLWLFEFGIEHSCFHPSAPYMWAGYQITPSWEGAENTIYARLTLSNK